MAVYYPGKLSRDIVPSLANFVEKTDSLLIFLDYRPVSRCSSVLCSVECSVYVTVRPTQCYTRLLTKTAAYSNDSYRACVRLFIGGGGGVLLFIDMCNFCYILR